MWKSFQKFKPSRYGSRKYYLIISSVGAIVIESNNKYFLCESKIEF